MLFHGAVFWISVLPAGSAPPLLPPDTGSYYCWDEEEGAQVHLADSCGRSWGSYTNASAGKSCLFSPCSSWRVYVALNRGLDTKWFLIL